MTAGAPERGSYYLLGHTPSELDRLDLQGKLYLEITRRALLDAGLVAGQRVLDIGCGTGDVSLVAAEIVGPEGGVVGIDRGGSALEGARRKAAEAGARHVSFRVSEIDAFDEPGAYDALVGRFVLMHQPDPVATLAAAARAVRPGGAIVFIESWMTLLRDGRDSHPPSPLYGRVVRWKCDVVGSAGADLDAGGRLRSVFIEAGLPAPRTRLEASLVGGPDSAYYRYVAESVRSMLPAAERSGLPGLEALDVTSPEELAEKLRDEAVAGGGVLVAWPVVVATTRTR